MSHLSWNFTSNKYIRNLIIDDGDEMVTFTFPNEERKIKCSKALLCEMSAVFKTMFGEKWGSENLSVELNDIVAFNQFTTFQLFVEILYGMRQIYSLSDVEACWVFFYAHKYDVKDVSDQIVESVTSKLRYGIKLDQLEIFIEFSNIYQLPDFAKKLDKAILDLNETNAMNFFELAKRSGMCALQERITAYMMTIPPGNDWPKEALQSTIKALQVENHTLKAKAKEKEWEADQLLLTKQKGRTLNNRLTKVKKTR